MRKSYCFLAAFLMAALFSVSTNAQSITVSGNVKVSGTKENVPAVSVVVKGSSLGTYTNSDGNFSIRVAKLPVTLVISSIGFETKEATVNETNEVNIELVPASIAGSEIVVAEARAPQRILEAPVTV